MKKLLPLAIALALSSTIGIAEPKQAAVRPAKPSYKTDVVLTSSNHVSFRGEFTETSVASAELALKALDSKVPSKDPIYLIILSPGGDIDAGIELIEYANTLNRPVSTITNFAASMGFQTVQGVNGERLILENGTLMSHRAKGGFSGEFPGQLDTRRNYYGRRVDRLDRKTVARTHGKQTLASYKELIREEYWCDGQDCVDGGFADRVVTAQCDASLDGSTTSSQTLAFMGMAMNISLTLAKCPLITGALPNPAGDSKVRVTLDGKLVTAAVLATFTPREQREYKELVDQAAALLEGSSRDVIKY